MAAKQKIMIVDDDSNIAELIALYLNKECFDTRIVGDGEAALRSFDSFAPNLILLDLMLPGMDGYQVCREIRQRSNVPIIMLSAKGEIFDKVLGLELGADDYIIKPFDSKELVARVKSHIHIHNLLLESQTEKEETEIAYQNLTILPKSRMVYLDGKEVVLVNKEFELLLFLAENPNIVFSRDTLFDRIWGMDSLGDASTVTVHINRLRDKISKNALKTQFIETVWGAGYRFRIS